jgi:hypothetical protein
MDSQARVVASNTASVNQIYILSGYTKAVGFSDGFFFQERTHIGCVVPLN